MAAGVGTLTAGEDRMDCYCFLFAHYFFLFIVNLFKCSHHHLPPSRCIFFLLANSSEAASRHRASATIAVTLWQPHAARPCAQCRQGPRLLHGGASPLLHRDVANAPRI